MRRQTTRRQTTKFSFMRNTFLTGLLILIPLVATYLLVVFLFDLLSRAGAPLLQALFGPLKLDRIWWIEPLAPVVNFGLALAEIFLLGLGGTNFIGRQILGAVNALIARPLMKPQQEPAL